MDDIRAERSPLKERNFNNHVGPRRSALKNEWILPEAQNEPIACQEPTLLQREARRHTNMRLVYFDGQRGPKSLGKLN